MKPFDILIRDHVNLIMKEHRFKRYGRVYVYHEEGRHQASIQFRAWPLPDYEISFHADAWVRPLVWVEWEHRDSEIEKLPKSALRTGGIWWRRINFSRNMGGNWKFNSNDTTAIDELTTKLHDMCALLVRMTDPKVLLETIRDPATPRSDIATSLRESALAIMLCDAGPSPELEAVLRILEGEDPQHIVAVWVRERLASR